MYTGYWMVPQQGQPPAPSGPERRPAYQVERTQPPASVQRLLPVLPVPGVAMVAYPVLPLGTRDRRYWF